MPTGSKPKATRREPNEPTVTPKAGVPFDPSAYRTTEEPSATAPPTRGARPARDTTETAARALRQKVQWDQLVGIRGLVVLDSWEDSDETYGDYVGTVIRLPATGKAPQTDVLALTSASTRAGKALHGQHAKGVLGAQVGDGSDGVPVTVKAKKSPLHPDGNPMVILTFG